MEGTAGTLAAQSASSLSGGSTTPLQTLQSKFNFTVASIEENKSLVFNSKAAANKFNELIFSRLNMGSASQPGSKKSVQPVDQSSKYQVVLTQNQFDNIQTLSSIKSLKVASPIKYLPSQIACMTTSIDKQETLPDGTKLKFQTTTNSINIDLSKPGKHYAHTISINFNPDGTLIMKTYVGYLSHSTQPTESTYNTTDMTCRININGYPAESTTALSDKDNEQILASIDSANLLKKYYEDSLTKDDLIDLMKNKIVPNNIVAKAAWKLRESPFDLGNNRLLEAFKLRTGDADTDSTSLRAKLMVFYRKHNPSIT